MAKEQVSSILRALEILECFMDNETEWTLKRLVAQLDLPTTTVHRQLSTLTDRGYLVQDPIRKSYRVGPRLLLLSSTVLSHSDLRSTARPELEKLSATVKETINLSVMLDREIFYLDKVETFRSVVCNTKVGTRAPAHATSGGKIMLAFHDPDYVDAYCRDLPQMQRLTDRTVFSPDLLREQLAQARINGFAIDDGEIEPGLICVGAPIFGLDQTVMAAGQHRRSHLPYERRAGRDDSCREGHCRQHLPPDGWVAVMWPVFQLSGAGAHKDSRSCCFYFRFRNSSGSLQPRPFPRSVARIWGGWSR